MLVCRVRHGWLQKAGSCISQPVIHYYNFFHFPTPIEIKVRGEVIYTQPNACILSSPREPRWFYFEKDTTMNWMHAYVDISGLLEKYDIPLNCVFYPSNPGFISDMFRRMMLEYLSDDPFKQDILDNYAGEFLVKLSRSIHSSTAELKMSSADQKKLRDLRLEMLSHPEEKWTVSHMAQRVSLSPSRFHAVYKALFGSSPVKDVINARMDYAKSLLLMEESPSLMEIAEQLGYTNQYHFIRKFKEVTGMPQALTGKITDKNIPLIHQGDICYSSLLRATS